MVTRMRSENEMRVAVVGTDETVAEATVVEAGYGFDRSGDVAEEAGDPTNVFPNGTGILIPDHNVMCFMDLSNARTNGIGVVLRGVEAVCSGRIISRVAPQLFFWT